MGRPGVIIETARGVEYGECVKENTLVEDSAVVQPLRPMIRVATEEDKKTLQRNREKEERAFRICQEKIAEHKLEMKLVEVEYNFEGNKILFFFTAEGRVDFRALVKDWPRCSTPASSCGESMSGTRGQDAGRPGHLRQALLLRHVLDEFQPVSIKMAKTQNLS